jgi:hypothetical protein
MWSNVISVGVKDKREFDYIKNGLSAIAELSIAAEESHSRKFLYLAGLCDFSESIRTRLEALLIDVIFNSYKLDFFRREVRLRKLAEPEVALLATMVFLDAEYERKYISKVFSEVSGYDLDGIYRFRLRTLRRGWQETADMCNELLEVGADENDIYNVISYIAASFGKTPRAVYVTEIDKGFSVTEADGTPLPVYPLFADNGYNLLYSLIGARVTLVSFSSPPKKSLLKAIKHIAAVKS